MKRKTGNFDLLPHPRFVHRRRGFLQLRRKPRLFFSAEISADCRQAVLRRLHSVAKHVGLELEPSIFKPANHSDAAGAKSGSRAAAQNGNIFVVQTKSAPAHKDGHALRIDRRGVWIEFREAGGLRAAVATFRQLLRQFDRRLPCVEICDWPDFPRRGVMLDVSRGRVPKLATLLELVDHLADFKINEFQLYTEHTFAYRKHKSVWRGWGALTGVEIRKLDARCRELGIDLVPNQNSFGHLRYFLEDPRLKHLAEVPAPYEDSSGNFVRRPSTLAPQDSKTLPFLRGLYDELLPNFSSRFFNVGCDETVDLGLGRSRKACAVRGQGRVYLEFLAKIHREVHKRRRRMMFWGDIILHHPKLIRELPKDAIALNWGYEANHPFDREARLFAKSGIPFYVCPGTSTWMTLVGRHDNALFNLRAAAAAGRRHGAAGYLITDWGDGGHPQPLAVSYLPYLAGASLAWCAETFNEKRLPAVLGRDVFCDPTGNLPRAAQALGLVHRKLGRFETNSTALGTTLAAPPPETRELFCHGGLKNYRRISGGKIQTTLREIENHRRVLQRARPKTATGKTLVHELDLAARMAAQSCRFMQWQQALTSGKSRTAGRLARVGIRQLRQLDRDFRANWPLRNKGTTKKCSAFLGWRMADYAGGIYPEKPQDLAGIKFDRSYLKNKAERQWRPRE